MLRTADKCSDFMSLKVMNACQFRNGEKRDEGWLYDLYCKTMKTSIEATWGWNESFQRKGFNENLTSTKWQIICINTEEVGGFVLKQKNTDLWLEMIIIKPEYQKQGIGRCVMAYIQYIAGKKSLPLRLSVIKANPVKAFYLNLGFKQYGEDDAFFKLEWHS